MKKILLFYFILIGIKTYSQEQYPVPETTPTRLFYIQHSNNHNTYVYDANLKNGKIDPDKPIEEYRIVYTKGGEKKPLTELQKHLAYGLIVTPISSNLYELHLAASKKLKFYLNLNSQQKPVLYTTVNDRKMYIDRMFIDLKDGSKGLNTKVEDVLFEGRDYQTGKKVTEKVLLN